MSLPFRNNIIIMFHIVNDINWFLQTIELLSRFYDIIAIKDVNSFFNQERIYKSSCVLSFDDGDESFYSNVFPLLKKKNIPAVLYVSPKRISERKNFWFQEIRGYDPLMLKHFIADYLSIEYSLLKSFINADILKCLKIKQIEEIISIYQRETKEVPKDCVLITPEQLIEMHKSGFVTIGAHSQNHPILANEDDHISEYEISSSIKELSCLLDNEVKYFAYPNGTKHLDYSEREIKFLNYNGVSVTVSTNIGDFKKCDNRQEVPRIGLTYGSNQFIIAKIILCKYWKIFNMREYKQRIKIYAILRDYGKL